MDVIYCATCDCYDGHACAGYGEPLTLGGQEMLLVRVTAHGDAGTYREAGAATSDAMSVAAGFASELLAAGAKFTATTFLPIVHHTF